MGCNSIYGIPFSQFVVGGEPITGDIIVGLRNGLDTQFTFNAAAGTATAIVNTVTQNNHGFVFGQVVYFNGTQWELAIADDGADAEVIGIVSDVINVDEFDVLSIGLVTGLSALVPGAVYFLDPFTPGALTTTEPTTPGQISKPLLIATSNTTGYFFNFRGKVVPAASFAWTGIAIDTALVANMGYYTTGGGTLVLTLPTTAAAGTIIEVAGFESSGWKLAQNSGQQVTLGALTTISGATGYLQSTSAGDAIRILCVTANVNWTVLSSIGNITVH